MLSHAAALRRERLERNRVLDPRCWCKLKPALGTEPANIVRNPNCPLNHRDLPQGFVHLNEVSTRWPYSREPLMIRHPDGIRKDFVEREHAT